MGIVSANTTRTRPSSRAVRSISGPFESAVRSAATISVTPKTAFRSGSSHDGNARRASVASKWVVAMTSVPWSGLSYVDR